MAGYNHVTMVGNACADPELKAVGTENISVVRFNIGVTTQYGKKPKTCFIEVTAWRKLAEIVNQYVKKGDRVLVDGSLDLQTWNDNETGKKRSKHVIQADTVVFLSNKGSVQPAATPPAQEQRPENFPDEDIPPKELDPNDIPF